MTTPLVSVIIPVYNCERYIKESLESIIDQSFQDYEIRIYNDGSTDDTEGEILSCLYGSKLDVWQWKYMGWYNRGCFASRDMLIRASKSKYIAIQDADDISLPDRLQKQIDFLEDNKDVWCVGSHAIKIDEEDNEIGNMTYSPSSNEEIFKMIKDKCMNPILDPSVVFRRDGFLEIGGYSLKEDRKLVDDFDIWCRAVVGNKKFHNIQKKLIKYRVNPNGNTLKFKKIMIKQHMVVWKEFNSLNKGKEK